MRIDLLCVGRPRNTSLASAIDEYEQRLAHYFEFKAITVKEEPARALSPAEVRERESERLAARIASGSLAVLCDVGGDALTSAEFAAWLGGLRDRAQRVTFVVGGAHGLSDRIRTRAARRVTLAPFTLPHELARLVLVEQVYRAGTILRGEPYHK